MKLYTEELYNLYMKWVDNVPDEKSTFTPKEIVNAIVNIIESNPSLIELPSDEEIEKRAESYCDEIFSTGMIHGASNHTRQGYIQSAKWMRKQILNQNK